MNDNPLDISRARKAAIEARAKKLWHAAGEKGDMAEYRERADELMRMEMAGMPAQLPIESGEVIEEASIQENLGELPGARTNDQGESRETPMTREELRHRGE